MGWPCAILPLRVAQLVAATLARTFDKKLLCPLQGAENEWPRPRGIGGFAKRSHLRFVLDRSSSVDRPKVGGPSIANVCVIDVDDPYVDTIPLCSTNHLET